MYQWVVFLHILGALLFFMAHGASMAMAFQLRREYNLDRIRAILDLSNVMLPVAYGALALLVLAGIAAGIMGSWFSRGWIWAAIVLLVVMWGMMVVYGTRFYSPIRKAIGLPYRTGGEGPGSEYPAEPPANEAEIMTLIQRANPMHLAIPGLGIAAVILWLMVFKPF
ncbi:MAG: hypothetical protein H7175_16205 [Burkholderiales bacterium]|nr:hypothetical protein [Anaerolineae bacterium]